jgi:hypothetical protein
VTTKTRVRLCANTIALATITTLVAVGCRTPPTDPPPSTEQTTAEPGVVSQVDPWWMEVGTGHGWNWQILGRTLTREFQEFGVRPVDDTDDFSPDYNGCGCVSPATAVLTIHAPGRFDPTQARLGEQVGVHGGEGYLSPAVGERNATLTWAYAPNAWAVIRARTTTTKRLDRLLELAGSLHPTKRLPVRLPLSLVKLPAYMPLSSINIQSGNFPTHVSFDTCRRSPSSLEDCPQTRGRLEIRIWPSDDYPEYRSDHSGRHELYAIPVTVGGRDGHIHIRRTAAAVKIKPDMVVTFELTATIGIRDVLAGVEWAPNLDDDATWPVVADWTK